MGGLPGSDLDSLTEKHLEELMESYPLNDYGEFLLLTIEFLKETGKELIEFRELTDDAFKGC